MSVLRCSPDNPVTSIFEASESPVKIHLKCSFIEFALTGHFQCFTVKTSRCRGKKKKKQSVRHNSCLTSSQQQQY